MKRLQFSEPSKFIAMDGVAIPKDVIHVVVIGAGGVGSFAIPQIMRTMHILGLTNITIIDGDKVEAKNIERQNFSHADIGKFKSQVIAERYGNHFGLNANYSTKFLNSPSEVMDLLKSCKIPSIEFITDEGFSPYILLISCVDNISSRQHIFNLLEQSPKLVFFSLNRKQLGFPFEIIWIDSGNTEISGQIVAKFYSNSFLRIGKCSENLGKTIFHLHPKMLKKIDDAPNPAMSCAVVGEGQTSMINRLVAYHLEIMTSKILYAQINPKDEFAGSYSYYELVGAHGAPLLEMVDTAKAEIAGLSLLQFDLFSEYLNFDKFSNSIYELAKMSRPFAVSRKEWREQRRKLRHEYNNFLNPLKTIFESTSLVNYTIQMG